MYFLFIKIYISILMTSIELEEMRECSIAVNVTQKYFSRQIPVKHRCIISVKSKVILSSDFYEKYSALQNVKRIDWFRNN